MPVDIRMSKAQEEKTVKRHENYIKSLPKLHDFLKQNEGYVYSKEEIYELFPEIREYGPSSGFDGLPGVVELDGHRYSYFSKDDPDSEEYKKIIPCQQRKKDCWNLY